MEVGVEAVVVDIVEDILQRMSRATAGEVVVVDTVAGMAAAAAEEMEEAAAEAVVAAEETESSGRFLQC